jgi:hypothetical protein
MGTSYYNSQHSIQGSAACIINWLSPKGGCLPNQYFIMRHRQSEATVQGLIVSGPVNGIDDYGLTAISHYPITPFIGA